jgi:acyl carrier protein
MNQVENEVIAFVAATLGVERSSITRATSFVDELSADSLD